ncbi:MAG: dihydrolipoyl dehydrogenase [Xanthomonadales bacterium]|nr:dihydrolipoyl dehydrogenase [Xanthomonadales bacterium]
MIEVRVPDIGDFEGVPVIEVLVSPGEEVSAEQSLVTLESDKATMEVPAPAAGIIKTIDVALNDTVSEGDLIATMEAADSDEPGPEEEKSETEQPDAANGEESAAAAEKTPDEAAPEAPAPSAAPAIPQGDFDYDVVVLGSGPGGYTAAFRAADLGLNVALVERYPALGGVCLNVGCIPSKALLHAAALIADAEQMADHGVVFGKPRIELEKLRGWKDKVVGQLTGGLSGMAGKRKVTVIEGVGGFVSDHEMQVESGDQQQRISFAQAIIAAGSQSMKLPGLPWDDERLMDSTGALELDDIPERLLVIGGGIIGLEMACVYQALGSKVTVVELTSQLMPGADKDLVRPLQKRIEGRYEAIWLDTKVTGVTAGETALTASFEGGKAPQSAEFDRVLVSVGRVPNGANIGADKAGVEVTERGFIAVDKQMRTNVPHIFAIGDIVGQPMLAHKATHEGKVAAEVCAGHKSAFDARVIPSVAYTDPEVAWVGVTEGEARDAGVDYSVGKFPWAASGRALGNGRPEGFTKLLFDNATDRIIGAGIVGTHAGDLIAECALAIEMGCEAADIGLTIHPHPTLSESIGMAAEAFEGTITDLYLPKRKK